MKTEEQSFASFVRVLKHRARPSLLAAAAVLLGMTVFVYSLPAVYESYATLLIQQSEITPEMLGGEATKEYVEQRLQKTRELVMSAENGRTLIKKYSLYAEHEGGKLSDDDKLSLLNESVVIRPQVTGVVDPRSMRGADLTYAFDVAFQHDDPTVARDVAAEIAGKFTSAGASRAKADAERASKFLQSESERLAAELRDRESKLADFRQKTGGGRPEDSRENLNRASDLEREISRVDDDLRDARARRDLLAIQLQDTPRDSAVLDQSGQLVIRGEDRLAAAQQELVAALARYSEDHPDVRRLRREIATLTAQTGGGTASAPTNPAYLQLQSQVNAADVAIRELTARRYSFSSELSRVRGAVFQSPVHEKQYADLMRDYELIKTQYEQMRTRLAATEITEKAAGAEAAESYVLINPARVPTQPVEPDRLSLMFLAFVLAIATGLGVASLLNALDSTVRGSSDVAVLLGAAPLGLVPPMRSAAELRKQRLNDLAIAGGVLATAGLALLLVN
jgi:polysaccharide biosynthesis transport protein